MPTRLCILVLALFLPLAARGGDPDDHAGRPQKTITLDNERIMPPALTLERGDVLTLQNLSLNTMQVTFVQPADAAQRVRCGLVGMEKSGRPPWAVFDVQDDKLVGTIPPGRFGSVCSLQPGEYAYIVTRLGAQGQPVSGELREKGQITVR